MCGDAIENMGNHAFDHPIMSSTLMMGLPWLAAPFHDFSTLDNGDIRKPDTLLPRLKGKDYKKNGKDVQLEDFSQVSFSDVNLLFAGAEAKKDVADGWREVRNKIADATETFNKGLHKLEGDNGWKGKTHDRAIDNIQSSLQEPETASRGAGVMAILVDTYAKTIKAVQRNVVDNYQNYLDDLDAHPDYSDDVRREYDSFARKVMNDIYVPNIVDIAKNNPAFTEGGASQPTAGPPGGGPGGGAPKLGGGPSLGGPPNIGGGGLPNIGGGGPPNIGGGGPPNIGGPKGFKSAGFEPPKLGDTKPIGPTTPPGLNGATDPAKAAMDAARNGIGQAGDAAKQAADAAKNASQGPQSPNGAGQGPPEGVLGLGPKGLGGAGAGMGSGAGAGGGPLPRGLATGNVLGTPVTAAAAKLPTPAGGAGLSNAAGSPGAGAPAAAQRGGDNNGKGHQVNKALRRKKNGTDVIGDADAVVAVVGAPERPAQPEASQADQPDQSEQADRGPSLWSTPQGTSRPDQLMRVPGQ